MHAEIVAIGCELLNGHTVNTNAFYISRKLFEIGIPVVRHTDIPDTVAVIRQTLEEAQERSPLVIVTGGLGPTLDDVTAEAVDKAQAKLLPNSVGTAPGLLFEKEGKIMALLPGVPQEMQAMLPHVLARVPQHKKCPSLAVHFHTVREVEIDPTVRLLQKKYPSVNFGIYPEQGLVTVRLSGDAHETAQELRAAFPEFVYDSPSGLIEEAVYHSFIQQKQTLALAESCTGGAIAAALTQIPGASNYFLGSMVTYSNALKMSLLGVPAAVLETYGAVSSHVAEAMALGVVERTGSDVGLAVTGIAGPEGGSQEKPVGTVWCAIMRKEQKPFSWKLTLSGNRQMIILSTVRLALGRLLSIK